MYCMDKTINTWRKRLTPGRKPQLNMNRYSNRNLWSVFENIRIWWAYGNISLWTLICCCLSYTVHCSWRKYMYFYTIVVCFLSMPMRAGPWIDLLEHLFFKNLVFTTVVRIRVRIGSGSRQAKMTRKRKVSKCFLWRVGDFLCSLKSFIKAYE